ncbi:ABC-2 transporter permease [Paenibacillus thermotolerans]|uniref:ABC-2 transporter permease n=1 Tax=Paenibacillus thermotolerans TaxID=3027807 RepID=UPI002368027F|nr:MULTISPECIES: ABC-2 transporter permease [unclassified Paenibacillus]
MLKLLTKDLIVQKRNLWLALIFNLVFLVLTQLGYTLAMTAIAYMLIAGSIGIDDKNNTHVLINSLPVRRTDVIRARFLGLIAYTVFSGLLVFISSLVVQLIDANLPDFQWTDAAWAFASIIAIGSITYLLSLFLDRVLLQYVGFAIIMLYATTFSIFQYAIGKMSATIGMAWLTAAGVGVGLLIFVLAYLISVPVYERKDLA